MKKSFRRIVTQNLNKIAKKMDVFYIQIKYKIAINWLVLIIRNVYFLIIYEGLFSMIIFFFSSGKLNYINEYNVFSSRDVK